MNSEVVKFQVKSTRDNAKKGFQVSLPVKEYRSIVVPGVSDTARLGVCYVSVKDIPSALDGFMDLNPRVPNRNKKGTLSGPVIKGILSTLRQNPQNMALKNQGIYLLVDNVDYSNDSHKLKLSLTDKRKHGIINGGHTYSAIREAIEMADEGELDKLSEAYVQLHIMQGISPNSISEIAEGLNRSKQVDDLSLTNLQGDFDSIKHALKTTTGAKSIGYYQGDSGELYISELLVYLEMFNTARFDEKSHPNSLYHKLSLGLKYYNQDLEDQTVLIKGLISKLPDIVWLRDSIMEAVPAAAKKNSFQFGRMKTGQVERAGGANSPGSYLPFLDKKIPYKTPNGWVYPMLAAFRANIKFDEAKGTVDWRMAPALLLPQVIDDLVGVCIAEHKTHNGRPELIGKQVSAYSQCYTKVQLFLAKKNLLG